MTRQTLLIIPLVFISTSCGHSENTDNTLDSKVPKVTVLQKDNKVDSALISERNNTFESKAPDTTVSQKDKRVKNALIFINNYVDNVKKMNKAVGIIEWVNLNSLATKRFKTEVKEIIDNAHKQDPELGLGADPIIDAQDIPDEGFELESLDEITNYLTVKGKDLPEFKLTMKVIRENGNWLVDGCGIVNIPDDKIAKR